MSLTWSEPPNNGGCPILGYSLMRDDGLTGNPVIEVNQPNDPNLRNLPTLRHANVALNSGDLGRKFTFQLAVYNREGEMKSVAVAYLFAIKPVTPS